MLKAVYCEVGADDDWDSILYFYQTYVDKLHMVLNDQAGRL